jgi:hypothetical protein
VKIADDKPLPFKVSFPAKVDQATNLFASNTHVVKQSRLMVGAEFFYLKPSAQRKSVSLLWK